MYIYTTETREILNFDQRHHLAAKLDLGCKGRCIGNDAGCPNLSLVATHTHLSPGPIHVQGIVLGVANQPEVINSTVLLEYVLMFSYICFVSQRLQKNLKNSMVHATVGKQVKANRIWYNTQKPR